MKADKQSTPGGIDMTTINTLQIQRREILEIVAVVKGMLSPEQLRIGPIAKVAHILLCDLCEKMSEHLAEEHKGVYPSLLTHDNPEIKNMAWGLINNDNLLKPEFTKYKKRWLKDCEFQFTEAFLADTEGLLDTLQNRMDLEQKSVLPRLEKQHFIASV